MVILLHSLGQKRKLMCCTQVKFLKSWVGRSENHYSFFNYFLKSTHKIWVLFPQVFSKNTQSEHELKKVQLQERYTLVTNDSIGHLKMLCMSVLSLVVALESE